MNDEAKRRGQLKMFSWLLLLLIVLAALGTWLVQELKLNAAIPQGEFELRVRTYLLEHPELMVEMANRLQARRDTQEGNDAQAALKTHVNEVFRDPDSPIGGNPDGNVTVAEFFDYNCPYCRMMVPVMEQAEAADPQLRIVYKEWPILGPTSVFAAKAALAANKQGKYVAFHRALYQLRGQLSEGKVIETAKTVGLDVDRLTADMQDAAIEAALGRNGKLAQALRISGTPGFAIGDKITNGATNLKSLQALIAEARSSQTSAK